MSEFFSPSRAANTGYATTGTNQPNLKWLTYTVAEAAQILGISKTTAYECTKTGEIKSITLGRRIVIPRQAIEDLLGDKPIP